MRLMILILLLWAAFAGQKQRVDCSGPNAPERCLMYEPGGPPETGGKRVALPHGRR